MDLNWSPEEQAFEAEVKDFLATSLTPELQRAGQLSTSVYPDHHASMKWQEILVAKGWAAPHWAPEHGGTDWTVAQHYIWNRERIAAGAPGLSPMGISMVAYVIMKYGTPEQQQFFLPRILSGEIFFCQGYSEPGSGSDLASLQTSAVEDGDDLIINGQKVWTTHANEANWIFALVRTSKEGRPQQGITFLLIDMTTPGVDVRPFTMTSGEQVQNAVFFTDVCVPKANVMGEIDRGWSVAKYLLEFERGGNAYAPALKARADAIARHAAQTTGSDGEPLIDDAVFASKLSRARIRADVLEIMELRLLSAADGDGSVGALSSMMKIMGTELAGTLTELAMEAAGDRGLVYQPHATMPGGAVPRHTPPADGYVSGETWHALAPLRYMNERAGPIYAGSNEIQRNIIAKQVLGL
ncbi:acyl-CoA dehydrogenase family protein [Sphingomonas radiodurans]|uniref:acyl-CoA dehydrogenase family protein n=1 Tax=Sphingomonas radiodurans TaxID=2890321 RepID=UPI001E29D3DA|nr:acyl-CoA dehydrogenase family protein [Sphingomonas radiodurans]WBH15419.1 acyl-CoA dehydrogenase family protein [Sphingomonas radiodurans]